MAYGSRSHAPLYLPSASFVCASVWALTPGSVSARRRGRAAPASTAMSSQMPQMQTGSASSYSFSMSKYGSADATDCAVEQSGTTPKCGGTLAASSTATRKLSIRSPDASERDS